MYPIQPIRKGGDLQQNVNPYGLILLTLAENLPKKPDAYELANALEVMLSTFMQDNKVGIELVTGIGHPPYLYFTEKSPEGSK